MKRLLEALATGEDTHFSDPLSIDFEKSELLGRLRQIIHSLRSDLNPLVDGTELTLREWADYLLCLSEAYLFSQNEEADLIKEQLMRLNTNVEALSVKKFAFSSLREHLLEGFKTVSTHYRESDLSVVRFCSLLPMRATPAKVVILMGLGDGKFPRQEDHSSFNLLRHNPLADYVPSATDFDRMLFLEALLSARKYFITTYCCQKPGDSADQLPSLLVTELLSYMERAYRIENGEGKNIPIQEHLFFKHPFFPFDKRYFQPNSPFKGYMERYYQACIARQSPHKELPHTFFSSLDVQGEVFEQTVLHLDLSELLSFVKNPLKTYLKRNFDIIHRQERELMDEEPWLVDKKINSRLVKEALIKELPFHEAAATGVIPTGPFREVEFERLESEVGTMRKALKDAEIDPTALITIEFNKGIDEAVLEERRYLLPAYHLTLASGRQIVISGRIEGVSHKGLLIFAKDSAKERVKAWPAWLLYMALAARDELPCKTALLIASSKVSQVELPAEAPPLKTLLEELVNLYLTGISAPCPLLADVVEPLVLGKFDKVMELLTKTDQYIPTYDKTLLFMQECSPGLSIDCEKWQQIAKKVFVCL
jgi:exodeoxyribonuclease V gamma subunit